MAEHIKYLGLFFDNHLNFSKQINAVRAKTLQLSNKLINVAKRTYGRKGVFMKRIVESVVKPAVLYGSEIWGFRPNKVANRKLLTAAQRPFLKAMVESYATTPKAALSAISGDTSWWIEAFTNYEHYNRYKMGIAKEKRKIGNRPGLPLRTLIASAPELPSTETLMVYTDANCRVNTGYGYGMVWYNRGGRVQGRPCT